MYLLDTNICIYIIKKRPPRVLEHLMERQPREVGLSVVTLSELACGAQKSSVSDKNRAALELFVAPFQVFEYSREASFVYGDVRATLERKGTPIGAMDLMIAAHALVLG